ncbi:hypothetical protein HanPSC8_Chr16g0708751 [Helianthus annuus]|nr:hypothetical protein HanIR_Chr16g0803581 [Helianthus annuus]KAJ0820499.1 hypothetical protein HanPSC8_Chr16g0708751 [Helianthus annuus]
MQNTLVENFNLQFVELRWLCFNAVKSIMRQVMHDATGVRLLAGRQVDGCYFSGVIYSMMAVVVGGSRILFFDIGIQDLSRSLKSKIKAAHSYAFQDSSTLVALDERPNLEVYGTC